MEKFIMDMEKMKEVKEVILIFATKVISIWKDKNL